VNIKLKEGVVNPRKFEDYEIPDIDPAKLPIGVTLETPLAVYAAA
jgi:hypothetical protein